jgi:septal ring factor EnvC (AmiA/AmiB activator)
MKMLTITKLEDLRKWANMPEDELDKQNTCPAEWQGKLKVAYDEILELQQDCNRAIADAVNCHGHFVGLIEDQARMRRDLELANELGIEQQRLLTSRDQAIASLRAALEESLALNVNWSSTAEAAADLRAITQKCEEQAAEIERLTRDLANHKALGTREAAEIERLKAELAEQKLKYEWASNERQQYWEQLTRLAPSDERPSPPKLPPFVSALAPANGT